MDVLLIGLGAIAREVIKRLGPEDPARVAAVLVRPARVAEPLTVEAAGLGKMRARRAGTVSAAHVAA